MLIVHHDKYEATSNLCFVILSDSEGSIEESTMHTENRFFAIAQNDKIWCGKICLLLNFWPRPVKPGFCRFGKKQYQRRYLHNNFNGVQHHYQVGEFSLCAVA